MGESEKELVSPQGATNDNEGVKVSESALPDAGIIHPPKTTNRDPVGWKQWASNETSKHLCLAVGSFQKWFRKKPTEVLRFLFAFLLILLLFCPAISPLAILAKITTAPSSPEKSSFIQSLVPATVIQRQSLRCLAATPDQTSGAVAGAAAPIANPAKSTDSQKVEPAQDISKNAKPASIEDVADFNGQILKLTSQASRVWSLLLLLASSLGALGAILWAVVALSKSE